MPKSAGDKYRLCYLIDILEKNTDEEHPLSVNEICERLEALGAKATRQTLYKDVEDLRYLGYDVVLTRGKKYGYYLASRKFDLAELKLMVDAVQAARFIRGENIGMLIDKIGTLTSTYRAGKLKRQVYIRERSTPLDRSIYENIDVIHEAIASRVKIKYKYYDWTPEKQRVARHNGKYYLVTPVALIWDDENYYLVAHDGEEDRIKHFRVDKLGRVYLTNESAEVCDTVQRLDLDEYSSKVFGMYGGRDELVTLICDNSLAGVIIDKFGDQVTFFKEDDSHFSVSVRVMISPNFYSWVFMFLGKVTIKAPQAVADEFASRLESCAADYLKKSNK